MRRPAWRVRPGLVLVLVLALLGTVAALADPPAPERSATRNAEATEVTVARAAAVCPAPVVDPATATSVTAAAPGAAVAGTEPAERPGEFTVAPLGQDGPPLLRGTAPGAGALTVTESEVPLAVRGTAGSAPGLESVQLTRSTEATMRGLAAVHCGPSSSDAWFVGSGAVVGQRGRVYLSNLEATPAIVDLALYGPDGPLDAPDARGISIAPGEQEVRLLDALAPGVDRFAVHVQARVGRVSAALRDLQVSGLTPLGADWVPLAAPPARRVTVPGVPGGAGERLLLIAVPGRTDAIVRLRLVGPSGAAAPSGQEVVDVRGGSVGEIDLTPHAAGEPVTVVLESDVPVVAGVLARVTGTEGQLAEIAYTAGASAITPDRPAVLPDVGIGTATARSLTLTAVGEPAEVRIEPVPPGDAVGQVVSVPADGLVTVDLADLGPTAAAAVVAPVTGGVFATYELRETEERGPFLTTLPLRPGRYVVEVPTVVRDLRAGLPAVTVPGR